MTSVVLMKEKQLQRLVDTYGIENVRKVMDQEVCYIPCGTFGEMLRGTDPVQIGIGGYNSGEHNKLIAAARVPELMPVVVDVVSYLGEYYAGDIES